MIITVLIYLSQLHTAITGDTCQKCLLRPDPFDNALWAFHDIHDFTCPKEQGYGNGNEGNYCCFREDSPWIYDEILQHSILGHSCCNESQKDSSEFIRLNKIIYSDCGRGGRIVNNIFGMNVEYGAIFLGLIIAVPLSVISVCFYCICKHKGNKQSVENHQNQIDASPSGPSSTSQPPLPSSGFNIVTSQDTSFAEPTAPPQETYVASQKYPSPPPGYKIVPQAEAHQYIASQKYPSPPPGYKIVPQAEAHQYIEVPPGFKLVPLTELKHN